MTSRPHAIRLPRASLDLLLLDSGVQEKLENLAISGFFKDHLPEIQALVGFGGGASGHKALWDHTKRVVAQTKRNVLLRWAALFHDVGKVQCYSRKDGVVSFHGHEAVSATLFKTAARRTKLFTPEEVEKVSFLIYHLGHVEAYISEWEDSAVRRLQKQVGDRLDDLLALSRADITTKHYHKRQAHFRRIKELRTRAREIAQKDAIPPALPKGLGLALSNEFAIPPSKALGDLMKRLRDAVENGELPRQPSIEETFAFVRNRNLA